MGILFVFVCIFNLYLFFLVFVYFVCKTLYRSVGSSADRPLSLCLSGVPAHPCCNCLFVFCICLFVFVFLSFVFAFVSAAFKHLYLCLTGKISESQFLVVTVSVSKNFVLVSKKQNLSGKSHGIAIGKKWSRHTVLKTNILQGSRDFPMHLGESSEKSSKMTKNMLEIQKIGKSFQTLSKVAKKRLSKVAQSCL